MVDRRTFLGTLAGGLLAAPLAAEAQAAGKVYRIGFIVPSTPNETGHLFKALREGLRELGYVEGRNVVFEVRFGERRQERLPALATELVQSSVDVIVAGSNAVIAAVKAGDGSNPRRHGGVDRSCGREVHREPCAPRWKHHWLSQ